MKADFTFAGIEIRVWLCISAPIMGCVRQVTNIRGVSRRLPRGAVRVSAGTVSRDRSAANRRGGRPPLGENAGLPFAVCGERKSRNYRHIKGSVTESRTLQLVRVILKLQIKNKDRSSHVV